MAHNNMNHEVLNRAQPILARSMPIGRLGNRRHGVHATSWGNGLFPIWVDRDTLGAVMGIRLELGSEKRRQLMEAVWARAENSGQ